MLPPLWRGPLSLWGQERSHVHHSAYKRRHWGRGPLSAGIWQEEVRLVGRDADSLEVSPGGWQGTPRGFKEKELSGGSSVNTGHVDPNAAELCSIAGTAQHVGGPDGLGPPGGYRKTRQGPVSRATRSVWARGPGNPSISSPFSIPGT